MISSINELKTRLLTSNVVNNEYGFRGCKVSEIETIEAKYGTLPYVYKQILFLAGHRAGTLISNGEFEFYIDEVLQLNERVFQDREEGIQEGEKPISLPKNVFFCFCRYDNRPNFILANGEKDCPVYVYDYEGGNNETIQELYKSIWEWIEDLVEDAAHWVNVRKNR
ncbi:hypothetical protein Riv7116_6296 [Rivularia sp. PCC 7116]|uniref:hypothetical protein n=1 Tax=Rivularia sp. PCC 7116 TaxID=373994 RepID=UPI00029F217A|nr:hypothetical protein [Rivularia sp. PCC 7116]AFY58643.1 hypothetical protein Riv7116_6296 [Rivularia sp. PCC 7116]